MTELDDRLLWLDVETVGVGHGDESYLLEVGWIFTDWSIEPDWSALRHYPVRRERPITPRSRLFPAHLRNHLMLESDPSSAVARPVGDVIADLVADIGRVADEGHRIMLAGNSVGFDRAAILAHDSHAFDRLHYHVIDLSVLNEVLGAWEPAALADAPTKDTDHRVSTCLRNSIERARWYRQLLSAGGGGQSSSR
jgi:oligoribonuclease